MKIFYDGEIFLRKAEGEINTLFEEITSRLPSGINNMETCLYRFPDPSGKTLLKPGYFRLPTIGSALMKYDSLMLMLKIRKFQPDICHSTYYRVPANADCFKVITVFDMKDEICPGSDLTPQDKKLLEMKKYCVEKADKIIAVSGRVRRDITQIYDVKPEKISVVYPGISEIFKSATEEEKQSFISKYNLNLNFILFAGERGGHKNFELLLRAFSKWKYGPEFELICLGPEWNEHETDMIRSANLSSNIRRIDCAENTGLKVFYSLATAFVYPSKYEGFGAPVAEAMACGAPVIAAASSSLPEITANAAQYFEPDSEKELLGALTRVAEDNKLRHSMREKGLKRSLDFNWNTTARETYEVYKKLLHG